MNVSTKAESSLPVSERKADHVAEPQPGPDAPYWRQLTVLYFGYASNLSPHILKQRCPDSLFVSLGRVSGWRWMINETGYANIVPGTAEDEVWGCLAFLSRRDELALDESEGVPWLYEKKTMKVQRIPFMANGETWNGENEGEVEVMSYVDVQRTTEGRIKKDYIHWVQKAIKDAKFHGMPDTYAQKSIQKYLPAEGEGPSEEPDLTMVRTMRFGDKGSSMIPRGLTQWDPGYFIG